MLHLSWHVSNDMFTCKIAICFVKIGSIFHLSTSGYFDLESFL